MSVRCQTRYSIQDRILLGDSFGTEMLLPPIIPCGWNCGQNPFTCTA